MRTVKCYTSEAWKKNRNKTLCFPDLADIESKTMQALQWRPRLPENEIVADKIIKDLKFSIKVKAVFHALFWLFSVPTVPAGVASFISVVSGCDNAVVTAWFIVVFVPIFFFKGVMGNVQKRLYVAYCLGFHSVKAALSMGWDGYEYAPNFGPYPDYFTQRYRLKMFRNR